VANVRALSQYVLSIVGSTTNLWQRRWELQTDKVGPRCAAAAGGEIRVMGLQEERRR